MSEVLVTTATASGGDNNESKTSLIFWNPINGTRLLSLRGLSSSPQPHSLSFIKNEGILVAEAGKPFLHYWQCGSSLQNSSRILCPGKPGPVAIYPTGHFITVAINDQILIWQVETGRVVNVINSAHFRPITCLKFTTDGSYLISSSEDGIVHVWLFIHIVSKASNSPAYTWSHHSLSVTGIQTSSSGTGKKSLVFTTSLDRTLKMFTLVDGTMLLSIVFPIPLTSLAVDACDTTAYVGTSHGSIYQCKLHSLPKQSVEHHIGSEAGSSSCSIFKKHTSTITCLTVSAHGQTLASSDELGNIFLWDTISGQLIKTISTGTNNAGETANSKVTNMQFWLGSPELWKIGQQKPTIVFPEVGKLIETQDQQQERHELEDIVRVWNRTSQSSSRPPELVDTSRESLEEVEKQKTIEITNLKLQLAKAESINKKLHAFCLQNVLNTDSNK